MELRLYNNLHRRLEAFEPADPARVTMYLCGPTVYNYVHIGNARGPVVFDVLARLLRRRHPKLVYARNITDVDDKINAAAQEQGVPITTITDKFTAIYREDMDRLGVIRQDVEPHATEHMPQMIAMIEKLIASGHAYAADGHVLFSIASYPDYGKLSRRPMDEMVAGARVEVAPYKRDAGDFVLWKPSPPELPGWDSPWGVGRPGWHIECSAMAEAHLGETIDIHAGGNDLLFPHHENEVAQSTCAHGGKVFARFWVHNGMLDMGGTKMSKSLGNVSVLHELLAEYPPEALRYALLTAHYRQPLDWSDGLVEQSIRTLDRLYGTLRDLADVPAAAGAIPESVEAALCDDLNTPMVLAELARLAGETRKAESPEEKRRLKSELLSAAASLGLLQQDPAAWFARGGDADEDGRIQALIDERVAAKKNRDFARADAIRDELAAQGIVLEDTAQGVRWVRRRT
ncbi:cysteine--tRNA ligase [Arenimonas sp.]|uniref:cysteine--tRNA ligase n=1 Tax=Arenimonas sp. TaxID=1872635 RepID=UPI0039E245F0